ncbi:MAG: triose-phosphate isomerase [Methanobacteriota archaeon]
MKTPVVAINMKTYPESTGTCGVRLARICQEASEATGKSIAVAPPQCDLALYASTFTIPILAQHLDNVKPGGTTGRVTPEAVNDIGCAGALINHSEYRIPPEDVKALVERCRQLGLVSIVCTKDAEESLEYAKFKPDFIAVEPPELIGGDISVTTANPGVVSDSVAAVKKISPTTKVLCGAGVKNGADVRKALELGADGVLLASGVVKAKDQKAVIEDMMGAL